MGESTEDKVLHPLQNKPLLQFSLEAFQQITEIDHWILVYRDESQKEKCAEICNKVLVPNTPVDWAQGGNQRMDSVWAGLQKIPHEERLVFIHDAARPFIQPGTLKRLRDLAVKFGNATLAHRVTDTIKETPEPGSPVHQQPLLTRDRARLWAMETPQVFQRDLICQAYQKVFQEGVSLTDDAAALEYCGLPTTLLENPFPNPKITFPGDWVWAGYLLDSGIFDQTPTPD